MLPNRCLTSLTRSSAFHRTSATWRWSTESRSRPFGNALAWSEQARRTQTAEELLVNPTVITLIERRGRIDCGGLEYVIIRYGNFFQILHALPDGHLSVAVEPHGEPLRVVEALRPIVAKLRSAGAA